jgi:ribosome-binding protein aMBF1 (putative translation factor)
MATEMTLDGKVYVVLSQSEYARLIRQATADEVQERDREIGSAIKEARLFKGIRQGDLADFLGVGQSRISQIESGRTSISSEYVQRILTSLGLSHTWKPEGWEKPLLAVVLET